MSNKILRQKDGRVEVGHINLLKLARMVDVLFKNGFSEEDLFNFVVAFLLDLAISDRKAFDRFVYFVRDNASYMRSKGVKSVLEGFKFK
jgi:hypothetical protein